MRVVFDTNVLVSAILWKGRLARLSVLINQRKVTACFTPAMVQELLRVASYPRIKAQAQRMAIDLASAFYRIVEAGMVVEPATVSEAIPEDPTDEIFLACAVAARADFIVSGDGHLLRLRAFRGIPILSPKRFLELADKR